jgi:two-component system response regulator
MKKLVIVIADDDIDDQEFIGEALKGAKLEVKIISVYDGVKLMDYLLKRHSYRNHTDPLPDLILLDLNMPLMNGFEALNEIRTHDAFEKVPVYVITTSTSKDNEDTAKMLGATGFYCKGSSPKDIQRIIADICFECFEESGDLDEAAE